MNNLTKAVKQCEGTGYEFESIRMTKCDSCGKDDYCQENCPDIFNVFKKLYAYESIGLEPGELKLIKSLLKKVSKERLKEIIEAEIK